MNRTYWEMWSAAKPNKPGFGIAEGKEWTKDGPMLAIYAKREAELPKVIRKAELAGEKGDSMSFEVIVGNIGTVYVGKFSKAIQTYREYVAQSKTGMGRAGGEPVYLFHDGAIRKEYPGTADKE